MKSKKPTEREMRTYWKVKEHLEQDGVLPGQWVWLGFSIGRLHVLKNGRMIHVMTECEIDPVATEAYLRGDYETASRKLEAFWKRAVKRRGNLWGEKP
jgi:hypothetical protein